MKDLLYLREKSLKEIIELIFQAYIDSYSDPHEVLKKNIISQKKGTRDGRQRELVLTEKGIKLCDEIFNKQKKRIINALKNSSSDEVSNFKSIMKKIIHG